MKLYEFDKLQEGAKEKAFQVYLDNRADKAYEHELPEAVEGMTEFMDSIHEWSSLPDWGGVYLNCGFGREDFDHIQFDVRANSSAANSYEWELANLYNSLMDENAGLFGTAMKIDEWYWGWRMEHDWWEDQKLTDMYNDVVKRVEDKYEEILGEVANLMEGLADGFEADYFNDRNGYFENNEAPYRRYHENGTPWTIRQMRAA